MPASIVILFDDAAAPEARVLDRRTDSKLWDQVAGIANRKYGWGDGLPVEIAPLP